MLEDYFSSNEFLASVEMGALYDGSSVTTPTTPMSSMPPQFIPAAHQLNSSSPFADSGIGLNIMASSTPTGGVRTANANNHNLDDVDDDVFIVENSKQIITIK